MSFSGRSADGTVFATSNQVSMSDSTLTAGIPSGTASPAQAQWDRLRAIIESLADGIVIVDRSGVIRFANPAAAQLFTRTPEALVGTPLGTPLIAGGTTEMEIVRRGGGEVVYAELRVVDTEWEGETVELVSLRDVTDRKYAEERSRQLTHEREARLEAEAASRAKSDFLAIMSHELRTPLNAILGYSELIELGISGELSDKIRSQVGRIRLSARHLLGVVNDMLDLAKVEAGRLSVANAPGLASEAIASALTLVQPQVETRNLTLDVSPDVDKIPPYLGDEERVRQIMVNLLSNAVKCTEPGGTITVDGALTTEPEPRARLQPRRAHIRLSITDTGSGILPEKLNAIFEPFVQAESGHARAVEGSGLGLTIGRRLARAMGGDLTVESTVGVGSRFSLWLPAADAGVDMAAEDASVETTAFGSAGRAASGPARVPRELRGLCEVSEGLLAELQPLVRVVVERIRCDPALPMAAGLRTSQVADHLATMLADIAGALLVVEEAGGEPSLLLADAMEIQRLVAERHGAQRARLGWTESALRREMMIIREELGRVVTTYVPAGGPLQAADAVATTNRFLDQVEYLAVRSLEKSREV
ncbi:MAG: PAS domain S-box protein [Gemmatimonadaceae bacterium]|nr:PAS domain S-box protein [Gemmatimonadaceae bacterium]